MKIIEVTTYYEQQLGNEGVKCDVMRSNTIIKGIEKFLIFLAPKSFLIQTDHRGILGLVKKNLCNTQVQ